MRRLLPCLNADAHVHADNAELKQRVDQESHDLLLYLFTIRSVAKSVPKPKAA